MMDKTEMNDDMPEPTIVTCPVTGDRIDFGIVREHEKRIVRLLWRVAAECRISILEVYEMVRIQAFGLSDFEPYRDFYKHGDFLWSLKQDRELLKLSLPFEEALAIWERTRDRLRAFAHRSSDPADRARIEAFLIDREASMAARAERARNRRAQQCQ
jgi:hypothetical protein